MLSIPPRHLRSHWLERRILLLVMAVVHRPRLVLIIASILLVASVVAAKLWLNVSSDDEKLFSQKLSFRHEYSEFERRFPENDALYIAIQKSEKPGAADPSIQRWIEAANAVGDAVRAVPKKYVENVDVHVPLEKLGHQGVLFEDRSALKSDFEGVKELSQLAAVWNGTGNFGIPGIPLGPALLGKTAVGRFLTAMTLKGDPRALPLVQLCASGWLETIRRPSADVAIGGTVPDLKLLAADNPSSLGYYWQPDYSHPDARLHPDSVPHLLLVRVYPRIDYSTLKSTAEPVIVIRKAIAPVKARFPEFTIGTTGRPAIDADEMAQTDHDSHLAETIAAIVVFIGLWAMLRSFWLALVSELALGVGIGWTFGWATATVGQLNLLSIVFLIALIGIGMDYLVQILMRYRSESRRFARPKAIWTRVFKHVSAPINTACLGAAWAFLVSIFTNFRGAADLGIIAGGGLLLCLLAGYTVLPALLTIFPARLKVDIARRPSGQPPKPRGKLWMIPPLLWCATIAAFVPYAFRAHFNPNVLDLQAPNLESTRLVRKLQPWSSVVLSKDLQKLREIRSAVIKSPYVADTESILNAQDNEQWLVAHQGELPAIDWTTPDPILAADVPALAGKANALADRLSAMPAPAASEDLEQRRQTVSTLRQFAEAAGKHPDDELAAKLTRWQTVFVKQLRDLIEPFHPRPLDISAVPIEVRSHYVSSDGFYALYINPKPNMNLWDRDNLGQFVNSVSAQVQKVPGAPPVTGIAHNVYFTTREVRKSFTHSTIYALAIILLLVMIDLRSILHTLFAVSVLGLGLPLLIGLMGRFDISWNFANFFGLPILIGAGHEYGVFMIHRYREALRDPRRVWRFWDVSDRALLLCAYITSSCFGFFWLISEHRGLRSLGLVMALGTACIYLSTIMVLRPLLLWRLERRRAAQTVNAPADGPTR